MAVGNGKILRFDGEKAVGIAISTAQGGNVVTMGEALKRFGPQAFDPTGGRLDQDIGRQGGAHKAGEYYR